MAMLTRIKTACFLILGLALVLVAPQPIVGVLVLMVVVGAIEEMIAILFADGSDKVSIIKCKLPHLFKQRIAIEGIVIGCVQCALLITCSDVGGGFAVRCATLGYLCCRYCGVCNKS